MSLSRPFILRPIATSLLMVAVIIAGGVAYKQLPVSALPEVDYPTIQVTAFYPGASPDVVATSVTAPLERQFGRARPQPGSMDRSEPPRDDQRGQLLRHRLDIYDHAASQIVATLRATDEWLLSPLCSRLIAARCGETGIGRNTTTPHAIRVTQTPANQ